MKERLLELIDKTEEIEALFHWTKGLPGFTTTSSEIIYDVQEFQIWLRELKCELQEIHDRTKNVFIWGVINDVDANFNGWQDRKMFNQVKGDLVAIKNNIDSYYPQSNNPSLKDGKKESKMTKPPKIFISHSSNDQDYVKKIVALLDDMGLDDSQVFCSSLPGYDIPIDKDIFDYLLEQFQEYNLHVIIVHSSNYYNSIVSMNEMGAAWVLRNKCTSFLLPNFDFSDMKGVVKSSTVPIKLDNPEIEVKDKLNQLYEQLVQEFNLRKKKDVIWEQKRDSFIKEIRAQCELEDKRLALIKKIEEKMLSAEAKELLTSASKAPNAQIIVIHTVSSGRSISVGANTYSESIDIKEFAKWDYAMDELLQQQFIKAIGTKNEIFQVTSAGFKYLETIA